MLWLNMLRFRLMQTVSATNKVCPRRSGGRGLKGRRFKMANIRLFYYSQTLRTKVGVNVIIPENTWGHSLADRPDGYKYPVLWLQSGGGFDYTDCQRYTAIELYAAQAGIAVVCSGTYCSGYMDTKHGNFKYFTQLSIETPRVVRHLFPLNEDPAHNYIAGFSMGG